MKNNNFNKDLYIDTLHLDSCLKEPHLIKQTVSLLYTIVKQHAQNIPYHNCGIYKATSTLDLSLEQLQDRLLYQKLGGMCYETSELLWYALNYFGFDVSRTPTFVLNNKPFNKTVPSTHNILIVKFQENKYLIDVGFGYNSIREPLELSFLKTEKIATSLNEQYLLSCKNDYYELSMDIQGELFTFYRFNKAMDSNMPETIDEQQTMDNYHALINHAGVIPIRDNIIKFGKTTKLGRIGYSYDPQNKLLIKLLFDEQLSCTKLTFDNYSDFITSIYQDLNVMLEANTLIKSTSVQEQILAVDEDINNQEIHCDTQSAGQINLSGDTHSNDLEMLDHI